MTFVELVPKSTPTMMVRSPRGKGRNAGLSGFGGAGEGFSNLVGTPVEAVADNGGAGFSSSAGCRSNPAAAAGTTFPVGLAGAGGALTGASCPTQIPVAIAFGESD